MELYEHPTRGELEDLDMNSVCINGIREQEERYIPWGS